MNPGRWEACSGESFIICPEPLHWPSGLSIQFLQPFDIRCPLVTPDVLTVISLATANTATPGTIVSTQKHCIQSSFLNSGHTLELTATRRLQPLHKYSTQGANSYSHFAITGVGEIWDTKLFFQVAVVVDSKQLTNADLI